MQKKFQLYKLIASPYKFNQDTDICQICLDLRVEPVKCTTCKSSFCKYCANRWKKDGNICPNRCCQQWEFQPTSSLQLKLTCPYECGSLLFPDEFIKHYKCCPKGPPTIPEQQLKKKYHCSNNHPLEYISNPINVPLSIQCAGCNIYKSICRSYCVTCRNDGEQLFRYCCQCRFPKGLTKSCCPVGHTNFYLKPPSKCKTTLCDICSSKILQNGNGCVQDKTCDFAICGKCYQSMQDGPGNILDLKNFIQQQFIIQEQVVVPQNHTLMNFFHNLLQHQNLNHPVDVQEDQSFGEQIDIEDQEPDYGPQDYYEDQDDN